MSPRNGSSQSCAVPAESWPHAPHNTHTSPKANLLGVGINAIDLSRACALIEDAIDRGTRGYVCVTGVHGVMEARRDYRFHDILNRALLVVPDGMPTVWVGRFQGHSKMERVFGPDLMLELCRRSIGKPLTHFLYGGRPGVAEQLASNLKRQFPGIQIVGTYTPPFRPLSAQQQSTLYAMTRQLKPDLFWVGLSTPKQERFMAENLSRLQCSVMLGVGAAFDIHSGNRRDAPAWIKRSGFQWAHRLGQEPRRLWKRYLVNNSTFMVNIALQLTGIREYKLGYPASETQGEV
jgi:N-acetylglucosaminyldiphosphoundecaprenol N-acetyl-beta-D-mannosaminyltransferase